MLRAGCTGTQHVVRSSPPFPPLPMTQICRLREDHRGRAPGRKPMAFHLVPGPRFVGARAAERGDAQVIGFPYEATASFRAGARFAPNAIRELSESIETYSLYQDRDLRRDLTLVDRGNVWIEDSLSLFPDRLAEIRRFCGLLKEEAAFTLFLGGEHTSTLAFISEEDERDPRFRLLVLDAHTDLRPAYQGCVITAS